jgi:hypothetical protein
MGSHDGTGLPFDPPGRTLDGHQLQAIAAKVAAALELWQESLDQTTRERTYVDVFTDEHLGVRAISWMADEHDTGYHDHDPLLRRGARRPGCDPPRAPAAR